MERGLVIGLSCLKGTKKNSYLFNNLPIFSALPDKASLVEIPKTTGFWFLRCAFTAISTGVSLMPFASLASVFP